MAGIPSPDEFVAWATAASAETTDPGTTLAEDGWAVGDAPASSHYNYVLNASTGLSWWPADRLMSTIAFGNLEYDLTTSYGSTDPWGVAATDYFVQYFAEVNRWYIFRRNTSGGNVDVFDSVDGLVWNASLNVNEGDTVNTGEVTRPIVAHGRLMFAAGGDFFISSDSSVANIKRYEMAFDGIAQAFEAAHDPLTNAIYVCGADIVNDGHIDRMVLTDDNMNDPEKPFAWLTVESDSTYEFRTIAVSPTGYFLAGTTNTANQYTSSDGETWVSHNNFAGAPDRTAWSPSLGEFWFILSDNSLYTVADGTTTDINTSLDASSVIEGKGFVWVRDSGTEGLIALFGDGPNSTFGSYMDLGAMHVGVEVAAEFGEFSAGQGRLMWPASTGTITARQALTYYGPKNQ